MRALCSSFRSTARGIVRPVGLIALLAAVCAANVPKLLAQELDGPGVRLPTLAGHRFQPLGSFGDPFVRTYVRNSVGVGKAIGLEIPVFDFLGDPEGSVKGDVLFAAIEFEYQHAVKDWLGLWLRFGLLGRLGTNEWSLLAQGITTLTNVELGWLFTLYENEHWCLSGTLNLWNTDLLKINLLDWVDRIIEDGGLSQENSLVSKTPSLRSGAGLRAAYAPNDLFGFAGLFETGFGEPLDRSQSDDIFINFGARGDIDLLARTPVPIGVVLAFYTTSFPQLGDASTSRAYMYVVRVNYTGRGDFSVGVESAVNRTKVPSLSSTLYSSVTTIQLQYYF